MINGEKFTKYSSIKNLANSIDIASKRIYQSRGFEQVKLISDWEKIIGKDFASYTIPKKLSFYKDAKTQKKNGTLLVEIADSGLALQFSFMEQIIIERISTYFGYKAVEKIKIVQNPKKLNKTKKEVYLKKNVSEENKMIIDTMVDSFDDEQLQKSLRSLGESILS